MTYQPYKSEPLTTVRQGATDALKVPSLSGGVRTDYKPPVAYCVGNSKVFTTGNLK